MKILFGFILGFLFGVISIHAILTNKKPKKSKSTYYGKSYIGNLDTMYLKKEHTQDGFSYSDIINKQK
jgi:hypothetical protein